MVLFYTQKKPPYILNTLIIPSQKIRVVPLLIYWKCLVMDQICVCKTVRGANLTVCIVLS